HRTTPSIPAMPHDRLYHILIVVRGSQACWILRHSRIKPPQPRHVKADSLRRCQILAHTGGALDLSQYHGPSPSRRQLVWRASRIGHWDVVPCLKPDLIVLAAQPCLKHSTLVLVTRCDNPTLGLIEFLNRWFHSDPILTPISLGTTEGQQRTVQAKPVDSQQRVPLLLWRLAL